MRTLFKILKWIGVGMFGLFAMLVALAMVIGEDKRTPEEKAAHAKAQADQAVQRHLAEQSRKAVETAKAEAAAAAARPKDRPIEGELGTLSQVYTGCFKKEHVNELLELSYAKDREAWQKMSLVYAMAGHCDVFSAGDVVRVDEVAYYDGLVKVRRKGQPQAYWLPRQVVEKRVAE